MQYTTIFFDLDDTLYPPDSGLWAAIRERIDRYMADFIGMDPEIVPEMRQRLWKTYGTTLRGLQTLYDVDADHYLAYVHDVPLVDFIAPNPSLNDLLAAIPLKKYIFTNADVAHAQRVLNILGVNNQFDRIIDVQAVRPYCKPMPEAFQIALNLVNASPEHCILVEDAARNLVHPHELGMYTILVGNENSHPAANAIIPSILEIGQALPV